MRKQQCRLLKRPRSLSPQQAVSSGLDDEGHPDHVYKAAVSEAALRGRVRTAFEAGPFGSGLKKDLVGHNVPMVATMQ